jgi:hypothetical protein
MKRLLLPLALAFSTGCANGNYGSAQVTQQLGDPAAVINLRTGISIPEGSAASANVQMVAVDGDDLSGNLKSTDPSIMLVAPSSTSANIYVFIGVKTGSTQVQIIANGQQVGTVPATVVMPSSEDVLRLPGEAGVTEGPDGGEPDAGADASSEASASKDAGDDASGDVGDAGDAGSSDAAKDAPADATKHD